MGRKDIGMFKSLVLAVTDMSEQYIKALSEFIEHQTALFARANGYKAKKAPSHKLSVKAAAIKKLIEEGAFGCKQQIIGRMFSVLLGEPIDIDKVTDEWSWVPFAMVVPVGNTNSHNYPMGRPVLHDETSALGHGMLWEDGHRRGNHMGRGKENVRPATKAEIDGYLRGMSPEILHDLYNSATKVS